MLTRDFLSKCHRPSVGQWFLVADYVYYTVLTEFSYENVSANVDQWFSLLITPSTLC